MAPDDPTCEVVTLVGTPFGTVHFGVENYPRARPVRCVKLPVADAMGFRCDEYHDTGRRSAIGRRVFERRDA